MSVDLIRMLSAAFLPYLVIFLSTQCTPLSECIILTMETRPVVFSIASSALITPLFGTAGKQLLLAVSAAIFLIVLEFLFDASGAVYNFVSHEGLNYFLVYAIVFLIFYSVAIFFIFLVRSVYS